jgi:hypothetical protein
MLSGDQVSIFCSIDRQLYDKYGEEGLSGNGVPMSADDLLASMFGFSTAFGE